MKHLALGSRLVSVLLLQALLGCSGGSGKKIATDATTPE